MCSGFGGWKKSFRKSFRKRSASAKASAIFRAHSGNHFSELVASRFPTLFPYLINSTLAPIVLTAHLGNEAVADEGSLLDIGQAAVDEKSLLDTGSCSKRAGGCGARTICRTLGDAAVGDEDALLEIMRTHVPHLQATEECHSCWSGFTLRQLVF